MHGYFDAPGDPCWATLGLSVAIGCQRRYVSYFHICVGRGIGGRTCEVHDVHEARRLRWRAASRRGTPNSEDGGDMVLERSAIGHRLSALVG